MSRSDLGPRRRVREEPPKQQPPLAHGESAFARFRSGCVRLHTFLYRGEPNDPKMLRWTHPLVAAVSALVIFTVVLHFAERWILRHPWLSPIDQSACPASMFLSVQDCRQAAHWHFDGATGLMHGSASWRFKAAVGLMGYFAFILGIRIWALGPQNVYEALWGCNMGLFLFSIALVWNKPLWSSAIAFALSIDQILWYVDVASFAYNRTFIVGVAEYLIWKETHIYKKITCGHHLWFTPLICYCLATMKPSRAGTFPFKATVALGLCVELLLVTIPRFYLPAMALWPAETSLTKQELKHAPRDANGRPLKMMYLNVNLSYGGWKDVKVLPSIFSPQWFKNNKAIVYIPYQNLVWAVVNCILCAPLFLLL